MSETSSCSQHDGGRGSIEVGIQIAVKVTAGRTAPPAARLKLATGLTHREGTKGMQEIIDRQPLLQAAGRPRDLRDAIDKLLAIENRTEEGRSASSDAGSPEGDERTSQQGFEFSLDAPAWHGPSAWHSTRSRG